MGMTLFRDRTAAEGGMDKVLKIHGIFTTTASCIPTSAEELIE
jgi:hypothetical protein